MLSLTRRSTAATPALLGPDDLVPDAALSGDDIDRFDHDAIAMRVAELACAARPPVNIALFGPWGSGKSSVYRTLKEQIKQQDPKAAVVRYDAWKYGGQALKRNFISSLTKELDLGGRGTSTELQADVESSHVDLWGWLRRNVGSIALAALLSVVVAAVFLFSFAFVTMHLEEIAYRKALSANFTRVGNFLAIALVGLLLGPKLFDAATVKVKRAAPQADDQFSDAFVKLVDKVTDGRKHRLVVFIDELDRCAPEDVVATLIDLKTFLDEPGCVFVVAADRDVLEKALKKVPQGKPIREDEPYYSTPGAFLDKIFQHQMALPPLRPQALVGFARTLVVDAGGLWAELRAIDGLLDDVVFTLVPAHVRSPRRVKVLLNNYATNMRVAQARGIEYLQRAPEIAKLTVLQTEFPAVAGDLLSVPRLLELILEPPRNPSDAVARALRKYSVLPEAAPQAPQPEADADGAAGEMLVDTEQDATAATLAGRRLNEELLAYLKRSQAAEVPDPHPDLLYVQGAGAADGLSDPGLGDVIDYASENPPAETSAKFEGKPSRDIEIAVRLMALHSDAEFGPGKSFLIEAVCRLAEKLDAADLAPLAPVIAPSVTVVATGRNAGLGMLPGALSIAAQAGNDALAARMTDLLAAASDDEQGELLLRILPTLPHIGDAAATRVDQLIANRYLNDPAPLHEGLTRLEATAAERLWEDAQAAIRDALTVLQTAEAPEEPTPARPARPGTAVATTAADTPASPDTPSETAAERYDSLLEALDRRDQADPSLLSRALLLGQSNDLDLYATVRARAEQLLPLLTDPAARRRHALLGIVQGPAEDWSYWGGVYDATGALPEPAAGGAAAVLVGAMGDSPVSAIRQIPQIIERLTPAIPDVAGDDILSALKATLEAAEWDDPSQERRLLVYEVCALLEGVVGDPATRVLVADLDGALNEQPHKPAFIDQVRAAAAHMPPAAAQALRDALLDRTAAGPDLVGNLRVAIAASLCCAAPAPGPAVMAAAAGAEGATGLVGEWLALSPSVADAVTTFTDLGWPSDTAIRGYARALSAEERTELWCAGVRADVPPRVLSALAEGGVTAEAVHLIKTKIEQGQRQPQRAEAVQQLLTAPLHLPATQASASELALQLLNGEISGDAVLAADLVVQSRGAARGYTEKLRKALQAADDRNDKTFSKGRKNDLAKLGLLKPPKKKSLRDRVFG
jgi:hypothetical protein